MPASPAALPRLEPLKTVRTGVLDVGDTRHSSVAARAGTG
jgi:hypothetical protein